MRSRCTLKLLATISLALAFVACAAVPASPPEPTASPATPTSPPVSTAPTAIPATLPPGPIACSEEALRHALGVGGMIDLAQGCTYTLTADLPVITSNITINGNGAILDGAHAYRLLYASGSASVALENITLQNGNTSETGGGVHTEDGDITLTDCTLSGNEAAGFFGGGGAFSKKGVVTITNCTFSENSAKLRGGGAVSARRIAIIDSTFSGNEAFDAGCVNVVDSLTVANSVFTGNSAGRLGGCILAYGSTVEITSSVFSNNTGGWGGGLYHDQGDASVTNSTFSNNSSKYGGGIFVIDMTLTLVNNTISGNAARYGGGLAIPYSTLELKQSIVSGNSADSGADIHADPIDELGWANVGGSLVSLGYNLIGQYGNQQELAPTDIITSRHGLGEFGGLFFPLLPDSPALDAIPAEECATTEDQRGAARPQGQACDIGAVEME
jgi:predicted outer membrane repeat protein